MTGSACNGISAAALKSQPDRLDYYAEEYLRLALQLGKYDKDYVDAYYGPKRLRTEVDENPLDKKRWGFFYQITYALTDVPDDAARFHAQWRRWRAGKVALGLCACETLQLFLH